jgi:hypothetical protein
MAPGSGIHRAVLLLAQCPLWVISGQYIVQEKATKKCKVVETKPTETTWIQVGPASFKTQSDAEKQIKTVCVEK